MTFTAYIQRQKNAIRDRHMSEMFLINRGDFIFMGNDGTESGGRSTEEIFNEIDGMNGLNTAERIARTPRIKRRAAC